MMREDEMEEEEEESEEESEEEEEEEAGGQQKQFNQVMLQAQNRMILIAVLSDQKDKVNQTTQKF